MMTKLDLVSGMLECDQYSECHQLVDPAHYSVEEVADDEELILCERCAKIEYEYSKADERDDYSIPSGRDRDLYLDWGSRRV